MKKRLREKLPYSVRKLARRAVVRLVSATLNLVEDALNIATTNGLDLQQELGRLAKSTAQADVAPAWSVLDFLFLMDLLTERRNDSPDSNARQIRSSIIIPAHNQVKHTFQCLRSLIQEIGLTDAEIIIVNNGSSDETGRVLSYLKSFISVIDSEENLGFVRACNQGAAAARGEYLIFLNNDTVIQPGWLKHLVETVEKDQFIGAVGSMLLYPDGRLQEAGGIVWRDGRAANYGRGDDPEKSKYTFAREVDYCSGAALLVRKKLFTELGGFDERYAPAYYEDTDLCFGLRSLGYKVVYQPLARVVHDEGATAGTDIRHGFKRYQEINRAKFVEKWRPVLEQEQLEYQPSLMDEAADRRRGARIIIFDNGVPTPDKDSGSLRMFMILKILAQVGRPVFVPVNQSPTAEYESLLRKEGIEVVRRKDYQDLIKQGDVRVAILSRAAVADDVFASIRKLDKRIKIIFDTVDVHFLRFEREYKLTGEIHFAEEAALLRKQEISLSAMSDQVWCVTPNDKEVLEKEVPTAKIKVIPNIHILQGRGKTYDEREGLLFIGNFKHRPNQDALDFYLHEIEPQLLNSLPRLKLYVVGSNMPSDIMAYSSEHIVVLGHVPDVGPLFHASRLFIAPLRYGSGMKGKVGQSLSYGLPVVTTTVGAEGIQLSHGHDAMIADDPRAFAEAIVQAYRHQELWQRLSDNGYRHVGEYFTPQVVEEKITAAFEELDQTLASQMEVLRYRTSS